MQHRDIITVRATTCELSWRHRFKVATIGPLRAAHKLPFRVVIIIVVVILCGFPARGNRHRCARTVDLGRSKVSIFSVFKYYTVTRVYVTLVFDKCRHPCCTGLQGLAESTGSGVSRDFFLGGHEVREILNNELKKVISY